MTFKAMKGPRIPSKRGKTTITPELAGKVIRGLGLISNSDRGWFEMALERIERGEGVETVIHGIAKEREISNNV